ncbi:hypothetical protein R55227_BLOPHJLP_01640 [Fructobacillus tropaeoli]|uniref:YopX family protein n=1 Tax=Fructobacillus tropaeoli TaxID=709323 RepID=UPI002D9857CF|nr:hypothetical protein R55227_BLOPHJLP_01640 [Fructobacillus tropaeoli]
MREIKFRAWDENKLNFLNNDDYSINPNNGKVMLNDNISIVTEMVIESAFGTPRTVKNYVIEQYTGLHDKNGKEIYEGDIVKLHVVILSPDDKVGLIEYRPKFGYCINFGKAIARQEYWAASDKHTIKVIGNIHENPELLEVVNDN